MFPIPHLILHDPLSETQISYLNNECIEFRVLGGRAGAPRRFGVADNCQVRLKSHVRIRKEGTGSQGLSAGQRIGALVGVQAITCLDTCWG